MITCYIDPGTGSMLFSVAIGLVTILFFMGKTAILKLKFVISGGKTTGQKNKYPLVIYSEGKQYWNVFKPILEALEEKDFPTVYFTSSEDDPVFLIQYKNITSKYIGKGNKAFIQLNNLKADVCLMTTPSLGVYQLKRSRGVNHYAHILHAVGDATGYRMFGLDYFDSVLLNGSYQIHDIRVLEQQRGTHKKELVVIGCPYLDVLYEKSCNVPDKKSKLTTTVLVAPSWGSSGILTRYGEKLFDPLLETDFQVRVRPHPQSLKSEWKTIEKLQNRYKNSESIVWDFDADNFSALAEADIMISDYSSVMFDFMFLFDRPLLYCNADFDIRPYDAGDLDHLPWKFKVLPSVGIKLSENDFPKIHEIIINALNSNTLSDNRKLAKLTAWEHIGESGTRAADFLIEKQQEVSEQLNGKK